MPEEEEQVLQRLKEMPPRESPEVLRLASELYARERQEIARAEEHKQWVAAAEEMGVPAEYLERAAAVVQTQRAVRTRRRNGALVVVTALALWGGWGITHRASRERVVATSPEVVYADNFSQGAGGGTVQGRVAATWSTGATDVTPSGRHGRFLGQFGNHAVTLTLIGLPPHTSVQVGFKLFMIRSMDGNDPVYGPDRWEFGEVAGPLFMRTTFSNREEFIRQSFPKQYPGDFPSRSGALENNTLGYDFFGDAVYQLGRTFGHTSSTLTLYFAGSGHEGLDNESWGLDDVTVAVVPPP